LTEGVGKLLAKLLSLQRLKLCSDFCTGGTSYNSADNNCDSSPDTFKTSLSALQKQTDALTIITPNVTPSTPVTPPPADPPSTPVTPPPADPSSPPVTPVPAGDKCGGDKKKLYWMPDGSCKLNARGYAITGKDQLYSDVDCKTKCPSPN